MANRSHIVEWWGGEEARPTLADVQEQYLPSVLAQESVTPYIAMESRDWVCSSRTLLFKGTMVGRRNRSRSTRNRPVNGECINWARLETKLVRALVELLFNDPEVTKIQTDPVAEQLASDPMLREKAGFERQGTVTTPDGPAVYMVQTRRIRANTQCCLTLPSRGTSKGWRPWPPLMSNVKHHEGSGDRRKYRLNYQR